MASIHTKSRICEQGAVVVQWWCHSAFRKETISSTHSSHHFTGFPTKFIAMGYHHGWMHWWIVPGVDLLAGSWTMMRMAVVRSSPLSCEPCARRHGCDGLIPWDFDTNLCRINRKWRQNSLSCLFFHMFSRCHNVGRMSCMFDSMDKIVSVDEYDSFLGMEDTAWWCAGRMMWAEKSCLRSDLSLTTWKESSLLQGLRAPLQISVTHLRSTSAHDNNHHLDRITTSSNMAIGKQYPTNSCGNSWNVLELVLVMSPSPVPGRNWRKRRISCK